MVSVGDGLIDAQNTTGSGGFLKFLNMLQVTKPAYFLCFMQVQVGIGAAVVNEP